MRRFIKLIDRLTILILVPIVFFTAGIVIHVYTLYLLAAGLLSPSPWLWWVNGFMLVFNVIMLFGLIRMQKTAYLLSAAGFLLLAVTWTANAIMLRVINLSTAAGIGACLMSLPILLRAYRKLRNG